MRNRLLVCFTAILTYLPVVLPFHIISIVSNVRFYAHDFHRGSKFANSTTDLRLTNTASKVAWACDVTTIERECDFNISMADGEREADRFAPPVSAVIGLSAPEEVDARQGSCEPVVHVVISNISARMFLSYVVTS